MQGQIGQTLAIELDILGFQARDKIAVSEIVLPDRRIEADDP